MLILLREGKPSHRHGPCDNPKAAKMRKGLKWVYGGAIAGVLASAAIAVILQVAFSAVTSGSNREIIEGGVGIFAVVMMILDRNLAPQQVLCQTVECLYGPSDEDGDGYRKLCCPCLLISFLAVFHEGAETILFYVGIIPRITTANFLLGIGLAIAVLIIIAGGHDQG